MIESELFILILDPAPGPDESLLLYFLILFVKLDLLLAAEDELFAFLDFWSKENPLILFVFELK